MTTFHFKELEIPGVFLIGVKHTRDGRGFFAETYKRSIFEDHGIADVFVQDNLSHSVHRVLRGLHYQKEPMAQAKLVMVASGEIFDVAVDIRQGSPTYGCWVGEKLSVSNRRMLYVPVGFAHGFCVLSQEADLLYKVTAEYAPDCERGIAWNDPDIGIEWPVQAPKLSKRDAGLPLLKDADNNFRMGR